MSSRDSLVLNIAFGIGAAVKLFESRACIQRTQNEDNMMLYGDEKGVKSQSCDPESW